MQRHGLFALLLLLTLILGCGCSATMYGYSDRDARNRYLLVGEEAGGFGNRRIAYIEGNFPSIKAFINQHGLPELIYEIDNEQKKNEIRLIYIGQDTTYIFIQDTWRPSSLSFSSIRKVSDYEKATYKQLLSASASKPSTLQKIRNAQERIYITGLSLLPPPDGGWYKTVLHPARIEFGKVEADKHQSFVAEAVAHKLPLAESEKDFLVKISEIRWSDKESKSRFKDLLVEENISHEKGSLCVRYHTKYEDHGSKYLSKHIPYFIVEDIGLICRHPDNHAVGISIGISQRAEPNKLLQNFQSIANEFLSNAKIEMLPKE